MLCIPSTQRLFHFSLIQLGWINLLDFSPLQLCYPVWMGYNFQKKKKKMMKNEGRRRRSGRGRGAGEKNGNCMKHIFIARAAKKKHVQLLYIVHPSATRKILYKLIQFDVLRIHKEISIFSALFFLLLLLLVLFPVYIPPSEERCILFVLSRGCSKEFFRCVLCVLYLNRAFETNI